MSEEGDRLAEMARNRGLKLLRSRVRTKGKPGFGCFGLADRNGDAVFGMRGKRALRASAQEIEDYLRGAETGDWKQSLRAVGGRAKPKTSQSATEAETSASACHPPCDQGRLPRSLRPSSPSSVTRSRLRRSPPTSRR